MGGRYFICVNQAGTVPPVAADVTTGATETVTGTADFTFKPGSGAYVDGISVIVGSGSSATVNFNINNATTAIATYVRWKNATISIASTGASSLISIGTNSNAAPNEYEFTNVIFKFGATGQQINPWGCRFFWNGGSLSGAGSVPTVLIDPTTHEMATVILRGVDLSAESGTIIGHVNNTSTYTQLIDCRLHASATIAAWSNATLNPVAGVVDLINCNSGAVNYERRRYQIKGTQTIETTNVRTGGASSGGTAFSWKIVTKDNTDQYNPYINPFTLQPIDIWNSTVTGNVIVTLNILSSTTLKDNEIGFDV